MQSLNEELSSSNEELQSSNEELETTNEELQSTNEELQTAYSELKVLYDDKEYRTKQLEDMTSKLKFQTEDLRKQKELTEAIINTTPVAIIMTDTTGKITFANTNAQNLFRLNKKELKNRYINESSWNILDVNGDKLLEENMIVNIIKKTYETAKNIKYSMETGEKYRILVSINGSPIFDIKGDFVGIVFSIDDITQKQLMQEEINKYKENSSIGERIEQSFEKIKVSGILNSSVDQFNLIQIAMLDISTNLKNMISEATLLSSTLSNSQDVKLNKELGSELNNLLLNMNTFINGNLVYYNDMYINKKLDFVKLLKKSFELFSYSFEQQDIKVDILIQEDLSLMVNSKELILFIMRLFETIISLEVKELELSLIDKKLILNIKQNQYDESIMGIFDKHYSSEILSELFENQITNIEIKS
jgi:PAS domain S-box-containing protein